MMHGSAVGRVKDGCWEGEKEKKNKRETVTMAADVNPPEINHRTE